MSSRRTNTLVIRTPEGYAFSYPLAGPVARMLAWIVDLFVQVVLFIGLAMLLGPLTPLLGGLVQALYAVLVFLVGIGYATVLEWRWGGRTLGKKALGLRVMDNQAMPLTFSQALIRNLLRPVDSLPLLYLVGGLSMLLTRHAQRLGDLAAGTVVVASPRTYEPDLSVVLADDKFNSFRAWPVLEARLRHKVSADEARLAAQAMLRRETLHAENRLQVFTELAEYFQTLSPFPQDATDGLSSEQYIRNIVDSLYRPMVAKAQAAAKKSKSEN
ncbi:MAG: RDD family protein [Planctomycetaceae bacterium]|nr:RDD family protein [Planctomycetaceae bacterium]